jgi:hypothetical protein
MADWNGCRENIAAGIEVDNIRARLLADAGATAHDIMAALGHTTLAEAFLRVQIAAALLRTVPPGETGTLGTDCGSLALGQGTRELFEWT